MNIDTELIHSFFSGDGSERGAILTDEGQETLSMAKSLLEALIYDISNASVTVEVLLLLKNFKHKFLELVKTTTPVVNWKKAGKLSKTRELNRSLMTELKKSMNSKL